MVSISKPLLLSMNHLDRPVASRSLTQEQLHPESPVAIKKNLGLDELDKKLFPTLITGVRWWPFLCLAMDCTTESDRQKVFITTRKLKKALNRKSTARVGPETRNSFRPYLSMANNIQEDEQSRELFKYLQKKFDGNPSFFTNNQHEEKWKVLFKTSNGKPASGYVRAYKAAHKELGIEPGPEYVITHILRHLPNKYDSVLWQGAFSFALIRCLFGIYDQEEGKASNHVFFMVWKELLIRILIEPPAELAEGARNSAYRLLLERIESPESPPPLAGQTKKFRAEGRPVLASLRIPLFHRLYFKPNPKLSAE
jgi:hypothetical protein